MKIVNRKYYAKVKPEFFAQLIILFHGGQFIREDSEEELTARFFSRQSFESAIEFLKTFDLLCAVPF